MADKSAEQLSAPVANDMEMAASQLSAMVDDELEEREIDLALRRLNRDHDSKARWERYHLIGDAMQGHLPAALDIDFAARIRQAIEAEPLPLPVARPLPAWYKPVTGFALAASVVLVALFGLKLTQIDTNFVSTAQLAANTPSTPALIPASLTQRVDDASEPVEARLSSYLVNHNGYASMNSVPGMLPYVRMVGYQTTSR
ncbi:MAG: sigma-E factor negative regulatory protein [Candidatus Competibacter sp.]|nr:sigma-E factor negative regulatory protein [Candidatus Competibacter sp.]MDS4068516.1 sigma-E factor negative regulatory protein [Candidatus Competibacter sp.]